jgi:hypothetical protein
MADNSTKRAEQDWRKTVADDKGEAAYFARRYGLASDQLTPRAKLEAAARRLMD